MRPGKNLLLAMTSCAVIGIVLLAGACFLYPGRHSNSPIEFALGSIRNDDLVESVSTQIARNPRDWDAYLRRAHYYAAADKCDLARADLRFIIENAKDDSTLAEAHQKLGTVDLQQQHYAESVPAFSEALAIAKASENVSQARVGDILEWRAAAYFYSGDFQSSLADLEATMQAGNRSQKVARLRAMNHVKLREWSSALEAADDCADDVGRHMLRAFALAGLGRREEAALEHARALAIDKVEAARWQNFVDFDLPNNSHTSQEQ